MSSKQLARTVLDGRQVTFRPDSGAITGYLCGMDDFHWMVVTPLGAKHLIHKGSTSVIDLAEHITYADEPNLPALERVVSPFRRFVGSEFFGLTDVPASDERVSS